MLRILEYTDSLERNLTMTSAHMKFGEAVAYNYTNLVRQ
jgi:hypothetical protein